MDIGVACEHDQQLFMPHQQKGHFSMHNNELNSLLVFSKSPVVVPILSYVLLAPTGALVLMTVYYISAAAATFSDFEHLCLSILLQVSL